MPADIQLSAERINDLLIPEDLIAEAGTDVHFSTSLYYPLPSLFSPALIRTGRKLPTLKSHPCKAVLYILDH